MLESIPATNPAEVAAPLKDSKSAKKDLHLRYQIYNKKKNMNEVKERNVEVDIPAGIDNGMSLRL